MSCFFETVKVLEANTSIDSEAYENNTYSIIETLTKVDKQPLSGEIASKEYGVTEAGIDYLLIITESTVMKNNSKLKINGDFYEVKAFVDWNIHTEAVIIPALDIEVI